MNKHSPKTAILGLLLCLFILGASFPSNAASLQSGGDMILPNSESPGSRLALPELTPLSTSDSDLTFTLYLPLILESGTPPPIDLTDAWTGDTDGGDENVFLPGDSIRYFAEGLNDSSKIATVGLSWSQEGPCGTTLLYSDTVSLKPGVWEHSFDTVVSDCVGIHINTVQITNQSQTSTLSTLTVVNPPSTVEIDNRQAIDKCNVSPVEYMQTWWENSPYSVANIYIGGISRYCSNESLDPFWLHMVAQQGWSFIPTWVGPQAPCSGFNYPMSWNASTAYQQGRAEADAAAAEATRLGLRGDQVIYYDVEGYTDDSACRNTVDSFLRGWVERLHELEVKAGVYGSPCRSYIADWADNNPAPDDVWIAHWYASSYDPDATVWGTPCLSDELWVNHQRLKQYTGGHTETWGGLSLTIDSNALDGEVNSLLENPATVAEGSGSNAQSSLAPQIRDMELLSPNQGWVLLDDQLLWTHDAGSHWQKITPQTDAPAHILAATFIDPRQGWLVRQSAQTDQEGELTVLRTVDGGATWQNSPLPTSTNGDTSPVGAASLEFIDDQTGWVALKLQNGSNFSLGRLLFTQDGGRTWQERSLPFGEPVMFVDAERGWTAGGPSGDQLYHTKDGGRTWQLQHLPIPASLSPGQMFVGLPKFENGLAGYLPVTQAGSPDPGLALYATGDGGDTWSLRTSTDLNLAFEPAKSLPFSLVDSGHWWTVSPEPARLYASSSPGRNATPLSTTGLPRGVIALDFLTDLLGWALVQDGTCRGYKPPAGQGVPPGLEPFQCEMGTRLFKTVNGGRTWSEISPPF